ncbi:MAG: hypothetical protein DME33_05650 [Verrucomicrobia bacterium]|nr:MAG: hypothetical protein DME33_05650 [Verrucomicrobiota bacterium]
MAVNLSGEAYGVASPAAFLVLPYFWPRAKNADGHWRRSYSLKMAELWAYIKDICRHWVWWTSSTLIAAALAIYQGRGGVIPAWLLWTWAIAGIFVAMFLASLAIAPDSAIHTTDPRIRLFHCAYFVSFCRCRVE